MDSRTVTVEPIYVYTDTHDKSVKQSHKCGCERCLFSEKKSVWCPTGVREWCDFRVHVNGTHDDCGTCTIMCFPIVGSIKLVFCLPCASYNSCRNKCNGTKDLNYIC